MCTASEFMGILVVYFFYCNTYTSILWILNYTFNYFWIKRL